MGTAPNRPPSAGLAFAVSVVALFSCFLGALLGPIGVVLGIRAGRFEDAPHPLLVFGAIFIGLGATVAGVIWMFQDWDALR